MEPVNEEDLESTEEPRREESPLLPNRPQSEDRVTSLNAYKPGSRNRSSSLVQTHNTNSFLDLAKEEQGGVLDSRQYPSGHHSQKKNL